MKKNFIIFLAFIGTLAFFSSCEKSGDNVVMSENPIPPTLVSLPDLALDRDNGLDTIEFVGTPVNPGFTASATYFLEACKAGKNFDTVVVLYSGAKDESIKLTVGDVNGKLLKLFPEDQVSSVDFRIRANLVVDGGTGAPGTGANAFSYPSTAVNSDVTTYGYPRLDLVGSGRDQKLQSKLGDGKYEGIVKITKTSPFTLYDPDFDMTYGGSGTTLAEGGAPIVAGADADADWYLVKADINALTYDASERYSISIVGSALNGLESGWDIDWGMDYTMSKDIWTITADLKVGKFKFRKNGTWGWNMGLADSGVEGELKQGGVGNDIPIEKAGNYSITYTILSNDKGTYEIKKN